MTKGNGLPCKKCGTSEWRKNGTCIECGRQYNRIYTKEWKRLNGAKKREHNSRWARKWRRENLEQARERDRKKAARNREGIRAKDNRRRTQKTEAGGSYTAAEFKALCKQYGGRCACCGQKRELTFDHVVPVVKGGTSDISNGQPLCRSCNSSKGTKTTDYRTKPGIKRWIQKGLFGE